jgi:glycosyltransferase involved in cell wall biosynthesis
VVFVQPYVPDYRVPFFDALAAMLDAEGVDMLVLHGRPVGAQRDRGDATGRHSWAREVTQHHVHVAGRDVFWRSVHHEAKAATVVVQELASSNPTTYTLALDPRVRLMLWGHGKAYVTRARRLDDRLERWQVHRAEHVFVYTEGGAEHLRAGGAASSKLTVVRNSTDTRSLVAAVAELDQRDVDVRRAELGIDGPAALFVGGLDRTKNVPLLLDAADLAAARLDGFRLVIAGDGPLAGMVGDREGRGGPVRAVGRVETPHDFALLGCVCDVMVIPGRVGLVAVDAMALGLPLVTTKHDAHAPELEYLLGSDQLDVVAPTAAAVADAIVARLSRPRAAVKREASGLPAGTPDVEGMARAFATVLIQACRDHRST